MEDKYSGTRIRLEDLTDSEKSEIFRFEEGKDYAIPADTKHQIVVDKGNPIGITLSKNGRQDFRTYEETTVYFLCCPTCVGMRFGRDFLKESTIICKQPTQ